MKFRGKNIVRVEKPDYRFVLTLEDGSLVTIGPSDLPPDSYSWLYRKLLTDEEKTESVEQSSPER